MYLCRVNSSRFRMETNMRVMNQLRYQRRFTGSGEAFGRVAVLMGGLSAERDISLKSGEAILNGLLAKRIDAFAIDVGCAVLDELRAAEPDRALIALHGAGGEDGKIQALLEWLNIPYTGSGVGASALAMNKLKTKLLWRGVGLPTPKFESLTAGCNFAQILDGLGGECFVKPVSEGSSLGMRCVSTARDLADAYRHATTFDDEVIAEAKIVGREFTVAILNGVALPVIELKVKNIFYDYAAKYLSGDTEYICPAPLDSAKESEVKKLALKAFHVLGCEHWGRVDFMQGADGDFHLLEANTVPGMTSHSLVPRAANAAGLEFSELLEEILVSTL